MSDTDDTDTLLIIPPDFFLIISSESEDSLLESSRTVVSKQPSCTSRVIGKLVSQVHSLESRLDSLELSTCDTISSRETQTYSHANWLFNKDTCDSSYCLERKYFTFPRRRRRKIAATKNRTKDSSLVSLELLDKNRRQASKRHSIDLGKAIMSNVKSVDRQNDSMSIDGDLSSILSSPNKKTDKLLINEINEYLKKVENYEYPLKVNSVQESINSDNLIAATGDYINKKIVDNSLLQQTKLSVETVGQSNFLDKYIYLVKNKQPLPQVETSIKDNTERSNNAFHENLTDSATSTHLQKCVNARILSQADTGSIQPTSTPKKPQSTSYSHSFHPSAKKTYDRASKVLENYKVNNYTDCSINKADDNKVLQDNKKKIEKRTLFNVKQTIDQAIDMDTIDTELLSLSALWGDKSEQTERSKLEEERLKRQHCEEVIQDLQKKILDQQEKLAVALNVDKAKDSVISKLKEAWLRVTSNIERSEMAHKAVLNNMNAQIENCKISVSEAQKKMKHFETELYKALDLAHDYQEKCKLLQLEKKQVEESMEKIIMGNQEVIISKDTEIVSLKENYDTVMALNRQSSDCIKNLEKVVEQEKEEHKKTKANFTDFEKTKQNLQDEFTLLKQERDLLKDKVNEERSKSNILEKQLCELRSKHNEVQKREDTLESELRNLRKHLDTQKSDLKNHYQRQLEEAVLGKLQEFQQQLEHAEREMEQEARSKECNIIDTCNKQMTRLEEQHKLEIKILEEKQKEEINLYRLQLAQSSEKISLLESKLESYRRRRGMIASQLHTVMESQWRQALQILTGNSNTPANTSAELATRDDSSVQVPVYQDYAASKIPPLLYPNTSDKGFTESSVLRQSEDRLLPNNQIKLLKFDGLNNNDLQHYIKWLLAKSPEFLDGSGDGPSQLRGFNDSSGLKSEEPTSDRVDTSRPDRSRDKQSKRNHNPNKPPWKS